MLLRTQVCLWCELQPQWLCVHAILFHYAGGCNEARSQGIQEGIQEDQHRQNRGNVLCESFDVA
jgi:hypothetical protein